MASHKWIFKFQEDENFLEVLKIVEHVESVYTSNFCKKYFKEEYCFLKNNRSEWQKYFRNYVVGCFLYQYPSNRLIRKLISMLNCDEVDNKLCSEIFYLLNSLEREQEAEEENDLIKMKYLLMYELDLRKKCTNYTKGGRNLC